MANATYQCQCQCDPVNENNLSDATNYWRIIIWNNTPKHICFMGHSLPINMLDLDENQPYVDDKPKYERNKKLGAMKLLMIGKTANKIIIVIMLLSYHECGAANMPKIITYVYRTVAFL